MLSNGLVPLLDSVASGVVGGRLRGGGPACSKPAACSLLTATVGSCQAFVSWEKTCGERSFLPKINKWQWHASSQTTAEEETGGGGAREKKKKVKIVLSFKFCMGARSNRCGGEKS